jgi:hypothetical protein
VTRWRKIIRWRCSKNRVRSSRQICFSALPSPQATAKRWLRIAAGAGFPRSQDWGFQTLALNSRNCWVSVMPELRHWSMLVFAVRADAELAKIASAARAPTMGYVARLMPILSLFTKQARLGPRSHPRRLGR